MYYYPEPFTIPMRRQATSANTFTAKTQPWKHGDVVMINRIGVANLTSTNVTVHFGIIRDEFPMYYMSRVMAVIGFYYLMAPQFYIPTDYRIIFKVVDPNDGDEFVFNIFGHMERFMQGITPGA